MGESYSYIQERSAIGKHAGSKARQDIDVIFEQMIENVAFSYCEHHFSSVFEKLSYVFSPCNIRKFVELSQVKNKRIFVQYPFYSNIIIRKLLLRLLQHNEVCLLIHDVDSLRDFGQEDIYHEIEVFNTCKILIVHNKRMANALKQMGVRTPMQTLDLFDYLRPTIDHPVRRYRYEIAFAGNLAKSTFLYLDLNKIGVNFFIYGINFDRKQINSKNITYKGSFSSEEIPSKLEGSFGLIWDGGSIDTCSGSFGEYTRYNNPHKLSLYISSCLPVIVWSKAAIADFVKEHDIGFCIDSLRDLNTVLGSMTEDDYGRYLKNIAVLQKKVISGYFTRIAITNAMTFMQVK